MRANVDRIAMWPAIMIAAGCAIFAPASAMGGTAMKAPAAKPAAVAPAVGQPAPAVKPSYENAKKFIEINLSKPVTNEDFKFFDDCHMRSGSSGGVVDFSKMKFLSGTLNGDAAIFVDRINLVTRNSDLNERILKAVAVLQDHCIDRSLGF